MANGEIRTLRADEIDCRVGTVKSGSGVSLLLYKDARVDMAILDETYGPMNWQRKHHEVYDGLYCSIEVWDEEKKCWVSKEDIGTESNTQKEKGQASDSFKRAGFNWGIGRELYTAPFIWVKTTADDFYQDGKKMKTSFTVKHIEYDGTRKISKLVICDSNGKTRYSWKSGSKQNEALPEESKDPSMKSPEEIPSNPSTFQIPEKCEVCGIGVPKAVEEKTLDSYGHVLCQRCGNIAYKKFGHAKLQTVHLVEIKSERSKSA